MIQLIRSYFKKDKGDVHSECRKSHEELEKLMLAGLSRRDEKDKLLVKTVSELGHTRQEVNDLKRINKRLRNTLRDKKGKHAN